MLQLSGNSNSPIIFSVLIVIYDDLSVIGECPNYIETVGTGSHNIQQASLKLQ